MDLRKSRTIGRRTQRDILKGKNIRKDKDGCDIYEDYFTDSDNEESSTISTKSTYSVTVKQVNKNVSNAVVEKQKTTFISANSKTEFLKSNEAELENTVPKPSFEKSSLLLKEVSDIHKNAVQMQNILPGYDDLDLQIMQMCRRSENITNKNELSCKGNLRRSKADKELSESSKSNREENSIKETRECTDELSTDDEYDLELLGKKLQNASYDSPGKHFNETYIAVNSPENSDSDATRHEEDQVAHNSSDRCTEVGIGTTVSDRSQKKSPLISPKKRKTNTKNRSENKENNIEHVQLVNTTRNSLDNSFEQVSSQKRKTIGKRGNKNEQINSEHIQPVDATNNSISNPIEQISPKKRKAIGKNRNQSEEINSERTFNTISSQKRKTTVKKGSENEQTNFEHIQPVNATNNSTDNPVKQASPKKRKTIGRNRNENEEIISEHVQSINTANTCLDNSFKQISSQKRKTIGKKKNENEEINSEHIQPINVANNSCDNSFEEISPKKRKTIGKKGNEKEEINSDHVQLINTANNFLHNSSQQLSPKRRKTTGKNRIEDEEVNSDHVRSINMASNSLDNSFKQLSPKRRKTTGKNRIEDEEVNSDHLQSINMASNSLDNSFKQVSSQKEKTIRKKRSENEEVNSKHIQPINETDISIDNSFKQISANKRKTKVKKRNEQINSTKKQNKGKKHSRKSKIVSNNAGYIRKSDRQRFPPLAHWRNERILYHCVQGELNILRVDKGTTEDDAAIKCIYNRYKKMKTGKKLSKPLKFGLVNVAESKMYMGDVIKKFSLTPWNISEKEMTKVDRPYLIKRMFETEKNGFGFLQIGVDKEKPEQYMPDDDLHLTVIRGSVKLTIQNNSYEVSEKDMFIIPRNCAYSIKNVGSIKALLSYVVGKFQFLESLKG